LAGSAGYGEVVSGLHAERPLLHVAAGIAPQQRVVAFAQQVRSGELLAPDRLGQSMLSTNWLLVIAATLTIAWLADRRQLFERIDRAHWFWRGVVVAGLLFVLTVFAATEGHVAFLYFQF